MKAIYLFMVQGFSLHFIASSTESQVRALLKNPKDSCNETFGKMAHNKEQLKLDKDTQNAVCNFGKKN